MTKQSSGDSLAAMKDQDRHSMGDQSSHAKGMRPEMHAEQSPHTRPQGDLRDLELRQDSQKVMRQDAARGPQR